MHIIDPWDDNRADYRAALVASAVVNAQGCTKAGGGSFTATDFLPYLDLQADPAALEAERQRALAAKVVATLLNASGHTAQVN